MRSWCTSGAMNFDDGKLADKMYKMGKTYNLESSKPMAPLHTLALSEFRANAAAAIALVEHGATLRLLRHGKPVADLVPVGASDEDAPTSATTARSFTPRMGLPGGRTALQALLADRDGAAW